MGLFISATQLAVLVPLTVVTVGMIQRMIRNRIESKGYPLPPGPTPLPLIGNVLSVNTSQPWLTYTEWKEMYGDIMHVRLLDSDVIVLNSPSIATDLLEKRSQIYSDRPFIATVNPFGHDCNFAFSRYGEHWRLCRRIFHQTFRSDAALSFRPMQLRRARQIIVNVDDHPEEYPFHFATFSAAVAMSAVYDYEPSPRNDPMVASVDSFIQASISALTSEKAVLLKAFPFLLYIPDWLPGSWIKLKAREAYEWRNKVVNTPYQYVHSRMEANDQMNIAMVSDHITRMEKFNDAYRSDYETALKKAATTAFLGKYLLEHKSVESYHFCTGSAETTSSSLMVFTLAMVENPHLWKRAQAEIDAVIGTDRLPEFDDRPSLPYVDAIVRETLRWQPIVPLGVPHAVTRGDFYRNYYIPKGTIVLANAWAMSRDESRYPDAEKFIPERFLDAKGMLTEDNPSEFVFGFGRRICPGRHTADASVWSAIVTMLATLDFNLAKDADGNDIPFTATFVSGVTCHPNPFPCRLALRSHVNKEVLERVFGA